MKFSRPKGTNDFYGEDVNIWRYVEEKIREICGDFGVNEIRTPIFEYAELFKRGVGESSDIVTKEMFSFVDAGGRNYALRPEGTVNSVRAYVENGLHNESKPVKLYYISPCFRAERPAKGRYRQFHQFGLEYFGTDSPVADAEVILLFHELLRRLGVKNVELRINSLGCASCRKKYNTVLKEYLMSKYESLCPTCRERVQVNPLRVLDCKSEECQNLLKDAPSVLDILCAECLSHFNKVKDILSRFDVKFIVDSRIVRGLDYYTGTVFEFLSGDLGAQSAVGGGGRYNGLIGEIGAENEGAVGFGIGLERLILIMQEQDIVPKFNNSPLAYIGGLGEKGAEKAADLTLSLKLRGIPTETDLATRSLKAQMRFADKIGAQFAVIIGENEIAEDRVEVKKLADGTKEFVELKLLTDYFVEKKEN